MSKTIKFNLRLDEKGVRNIEGIRENFCVEDMLDHFKNKVLHKWLELRGYDDILSQVKEIKETNNFDIVKNLIDIFKIEVDEDSLTKKLYSLNYWEDRKSYLVEMKNDNHEAKKIISDHFREFKELEKKMLKESSYPQLVQLAERIEEYHRELYEYIGCQRIFNFIQDSCFLPVLAILTRDGLRDILLKNPDLNYHLLGILPLTNQRIGRWCREEGEFEQNDNDTTNYIDYIIMSNKETLNYNEQKCCNEPLILIDFEGEDFEIGDSTADEMKGRILPSLELKMEGQECTYILKANIPKYIDSPPIKTAVIPDNLNTYVSFENTGKYMIISMEPGDFVKGTEDKNQGLKAEDVNGKFPILEGLQYNSKSPEHILYYIEVLK